MITELHIAIDGGSRCHRIAVGNSQGQLLDAFEITHDTNGFARLFSRIDRHKASDGYEKVSSFIAPTPYSARLLGPWIHQPQGVDRKVIGISCNKRQVVPDGGRGDQTVDDWSWRSIFSPFAYQHAPFQHGFEVRIEDSAAETGYKVLVQPCL